MLWLDLGYNYFCWGYMMDELAFPLFSDPWNNGKLLSKDQMQAKPGYAIQVI